MAEPQILKQTGAEPLFPKVLWQRPQTRSAGGRVFIVGGAPGQLAEPQALYQALVAAGAGEAQIAYPDSLSKLLLSSGIGVPVASTPSGSFAKTALGEILHRSEQYDAAVIAPSTGNNSETIILLEALLEKAPLPRIVLGDSFPAITLMPGLANSTQDQVIIGNMQQLYKLVGTLRQIVRIHPGMDVANKLAVMEALASASTSTFVLIGPDLMIAEKGRLSWTKLDRRPDNVESLIAGVLTTFWVQNPSRRFEGLTTGAYLVAKTMASVEPKIMSQADFLDNLNKTIASLDQY